MGEEVVVLFLWLFKELSVVEFSLLDSLEELSDISRRGITLFILGWLWFFYYNYSKSYFIFRLEDATTVWLFLTFRLFAFIGILRLNGSSSVWLTSSTEILGLSLASLGKVNEGCMILL